MDALGKKMVSGLILKNNFIHIGHHVQVDKFLLSVSIPNEVEKVASCIYSCYDLH